ncbi:MAG: RecX family transcriptional regulator [Alistipes sp.]|jgi:regulatory protein|nr:RecX family transcriptional regulator [Alistipes sp.]
MPTLKSEKGAIRAYPEKKAKSPEQALASLMRLSSRAEKSSGDARRLMRVWGIEKAEAEKILARLAEQKFIDDARYAAAYTREKTRLSGWGVHKIHAALAAKGIARDTVAAATADLDGDKMRETLERQLTRRMPRIKAASQYELRTKLTRYGLSLGYDYEDVAEAVEKALKNRDA